MRGKPHSIDRRTLAGFVCSDNAEYTADLDNRFGPTAADTGHSHYRRDDVDIAVGILAVRHAMSVTDAAARLRAAAYVQSKPIGSLAHDIVHDSARFGL